MSIPSDALIGQVGQGHRTRRIGVLRAKQGLANMQIWCDKLGEHGLRNFEERRRT
eukprot:CAMPEP_0206583840 /NCGR_PEP_ID=MMETSP0325_2-20121206/35351_1 /ASSEMBLY_ACC=CAM_ASM_000347 /TAXON_ID=2866 /ORGANISM="Crypthecodinium cohnii, Strain Seligo" /LENGTH=54 /DNA_ID=CAMNT_0054090853 /DNA_START=270 /DNA_END=431 /DNA_ORIENTATION=+